MLVILLGVLFVVLGVVYLATQAIWRGRLSGQGASFPAPGGNTLEPPRRGLRFLGFGQNWPGIILMVIGGALLLTGGFV